MSLWVEGVFPPDLANNLNQRSDLRNHDRLSEKGFCGPPAKTLKKLFPDYFDAVRLTDKPWQEKTALGIGPNGTFFVLDPNDMDHGVWALNATSTEWVKNAERVGAPMVWGWYMRMSREIPTAAELLEARTPDGMELSFQDGFWEAYYRHYPEQAPPKKPKPGKQPTTPAPPATPAIRTIEVFGQLNGSLMPLKAVLRPVGGGRFGVAPGGQVLIGDAVGDGFGLAGTPGAWSTYYGSRSPAEFGLDPDKGVLGSDGSRGWVLTAEFLSQLIGAHWRSVVY